LNIFLAGPNELHRLIRRFRYQSCLDNKVWISFPAEAAPQISCVDLYLVWLEVKNPR